MYKAFALRENKLGKRANEDVPNGHERKSIFDSNDFSRAIAEYEDGYERDSIGILKEGMLHAVLKSCIADSPEQCEVRIDGKNIADIIKDGTVYEIQTESLFAVKKKLDFYLNSTDYDVNIVFPLPRERSLLWVDNESGETHGPNRSPKKKTVCDICDQLIFLCEYIGNPRVTLTLPVISELEVRNLDGKRSKNKKRGSTRIVRKPLSLIEIQTYSCPEDFSVLLPSAEIFTREEYRKEKKVHKGRKTTRALSLLCALGLIERTEEKKGRSTLYRVLPVSS